MGCSAPMVQIPSIFFFTMKLEHAFRGCMGRVDETDLVRGSEPPGP